MRAGTGMSKELRIVSVDGVNCVSAFDVINSAMHTKRPRLYWNNIVKDFPGLATSDRYYKFPGAMQRVTPVLDADAMVFVSNLLPGESPAGPCT
jgi:hypothetical protein